MTAIAATTALAQWAQQHNMGYVETSAKEKENVLHAFQQITYSIFEDMKERNAVNPPKPDPRGKSVSLHPDRDGAHGGSGEGGGKKGCPC